MLAPTAAFCLGAGFWFWHSSHCMLPTDTFPSVCALNFRPVAYKDLLGCCDSCAHLPGLTSNEVTALSALTFAHK